MHDDVVLRRDRHANVAEQVRGRGGASSVSFDRNDQTFPAVDVRAECRASARHNALYSTEHGRFDVRGVMIRAVYDDDVFYSPDDCKLTVDDRPHSPVATNDIEPPQQSESVTRSAGPPQ